MTYNLNTHIKAIKGYAAEIATVEADAFERKVIAQRALGLEFAAILEHDRLTEESLTPNGCYSKHESLLKPIIAQTQLVNECYTFAVATEPTIKAVTAAYRKVGIGDKSIKSNGEVKLNTAFLAEAVRADADKRWDRKVGGEIKSKSGNGKTKKVKLAEATEKVVTAMTELGVLNNADWDFRYLLADELTALKAAITAEEVRRSFGGKVLVAS